MTDENFFRDLLENAEEYFSELVLPNQWMTLYQMSLTLPDVDLSILPRLVSDHLFICDQIQNCDQKLSCDQINDQIKLTAIQIRSICDQNF